MNNPEPTNSENKTEKIAELVLKAKSGDKDAFHELYHLTWRSIYYMLNKKIDNKSDTLTVLNDAYIDAYTYIYSIENERAFMKWLSKIAMVKCRKFMKDKYLLSHEEPMETPFEIPDNDDDFLPEKALINKEINQLILSAVEELPLTQRETIFMFYYHNLSVTEISDITDCTENTVYKRLHDAKKSLKVKLTKLMSKGVTLYNMVGFHILREVFQSDIDSCTADVSPAIAWAMIAEKIGATAVSQTAAPVAAQAVAQVATGTTGAAGSAVSAVTNAILIKTVLIWILHVSIPRSVTADGWCLQKNPEANEHTLVTSK